MTPYKLGTLSAWHHPSEKKAKGTVIHVHGLGEHSARHMNTFTALTRNGYSVFRFDLRGSGESGGKRQWVESFDEYLDDVSLAFAEVQQIKGSSPLFLMGHSMGGAIALHYAAKRNPNIAGLILSSAAFRVGGGVSPVKIWIGRKIEKLLPALKIPAALDVKAVSRDSAVVQAYQEDPLNCPFNTVRQGNEILRALDEIEELSKKITLPTLLAHGTADRIVLCEGSKEIYSCLRSQDKTLEVFEGGFHELHNDLDKNTYMKMLIQWLDKHSA